MGQRAKSLLILWHLLSLDAPSVATLWTWFIARANHVRLPLNGLIAMATAVWVLYAADRLLDVRSQDAADFEERHLFHLRHRTAFLTGIGVASILLALLLPRIPAEAIRLYLMLGGLVFGYFVVIHATRSAHRLPKEIVVGVCFAAAVFIPTVAREPGLRGPLLAPAVLFAALCSLNCLFIYTWEHPSGRETQTPHPLTAAALAHLPALAAMVAASGIMLALLDHRVPWPIDLAVTLSAVALMALHLERRHDALMLRAAADLALLTPVVLAGLL